MLSEKFLVYLINIYYSYILIIKNEGYPSSENKYKLKKEQE